jgi:hypothetical protein
MESDLLNEPTITGGANTNDWVESMRGMTLLYSNVGRAVYHTAGRDPAQTQGDDKNASGEAAIVAENRGLSRSQT